MSQVFKPFFQCRCGCNDLIEVMVGVVVESPVIHIEVESPEDVSLEYGKPDLSDGEVVQYQCAKCGAVIPDCTSPEELLEYLQGHDKLTPILHTPTPNSLETILVIEFAANERHEYEIREITSFAKNHSGKTQAETLFRAMIQDVFPSCSESGLQEAVQKGKWQIGSWMVRIMEGKPNFALTDQGIENYDKTLKRIREGKGAKQ